jgi:hypothetical protein
LSEPTDNPGERDGQQQVLRVTFPGIRDAVRVLMEVRMDSLARKFHETHDMTVRMKFCGSLRTMGSWKSHGCFWRVEGIPETKH